MTIPERAVQIAVQIANDDRHGYSQANRYGTLEAGDFDCSSLVIYCYDRAFKEAGKTPTPKNAGASYTGNMLAGFTRCGFKSFRDNNGAGLQVGDILLNEARHTAIVCSVDPVKVVNARGDIDGVAGDSTSTEIRIQNYWSYPWDWVLRMGNTETGTKPTTSETSKPSGIGAIIASKIMGWMMAKTPLLKKGATGFAVFQMQNLVNGFCKWNGIDMEIEADGVMGENTVKALKTVQGYGTPIETDGECGKDTWTKLING